MPLRDMDREQMWLLLPPSLDELLPLDHPARFVAEFVDALDRDDWAELGVEIEGDPLGAPAYHPRALLSVWLYGFMTGVRSCRKLEAACRDQIPYLWLTGWQHPDHNTLWRFYKEHRQSMRKLFERTVHTAVTMKLLDLAVQAVDGTKVSANASVYRTHNAEELRQLSNRVEAAIRDLEAQNEAGEDTPAVHLPEELANKEMLREQVRQAMADLESKDRQKRINLTDGDARLMKTRGSVLLGYNTQAMVSPLEPDGGVTGDPEETLRLVEAEKPDLVILDLMLPGTDGIELMKDILEMADVPVIFLSAYGRDELIARAFDTGAVDYVVKPFSPTELAARIRAALRKREVSEPAEPYVLGDLTIDYAERGVTLAGRPVELMAIEYRMLAELSVNAGRVLTYEHLLGRVWGERSSGDVRPMRTIASKLRRKLGDNADNPAYIFTEPRVGYRMPKGETGDTET